MNFPKINIKELLSKLKMPKQNAGGFQPKRHLWIIVVLMVISLGTAGVMYYVYIYDIKAEESVIVSRQVLVKKEILKQIDDAFLKRKDASLNNVLVSYNDPFR